MIKLARIKVAGRRVQRAFHSFLGFLFLICGEIRHSGSLLIPEPVASGVLGMAKRSLPGNPEI